MPKSTLQTQQLQQLLPIYSEKRSKVVYIALSGTGSLVGYYKVGKEDYHVPERELRSLITKAIDEAQTALLTVRMQEKTIKTRIQTLTDLL